MISFKSIANNKGDYMMLLTNKKYDALMQMLSRIEHKIDAKKPAERVTGVAVTNGAYKSLPLSHALKQVMMDGIVRDVGQAKRAVQTSGLCNKAVKKQSVNALLSKWFLDGTMTRPEADHYKYKAN